MWGARCEESTCLRSFALKKVTLHGVISLVELPIKTLRNLRKLKGMQEIYFRLLMPAGTPQGRITYGVIDFSCKSSSSNWTLTLPSHLHFFNTALCYLIMGLGKVIYDSMVTILTFITMLWHSHCHKPCQGGDLGICVVNRPNVCVNTWWELAYKPLKSTRQHDLFLNMTCDT